MKGLKELESDNKKRDRKVHKDLQCISLSRFFATLEWQCNLHGRTLVKVDPKYTSKACHQCGNIKHDLKLSDRTYRCAKCGMVMDRDLNAALNIEQKGLSDLPDTIKPASAGHVEYMHEMPDHSESVGLYAEPPGL